MNIFVLDKDPKLCAQYHCDSHCCKMNIEYAQILCTAKHLLEEYAPYKPTHVNHPCSIWARKSLSNWNWLYDLAMYLSEEYTFRYQRVHKSSLITKDLTPPKALKDIGLKAFTPAMPDHCKMDCPVESYRKYYQICKRELLKFTNRKPPYWID